MNDVAALAAGRTLKCVSACGRLSRFIPSLDVADREEAREFLFALGCKPVMIPSQPGLYYMRDPFGLMFDLVQRDPGPKAP